MVYTPEPLTEFLVEVALGAGLSPGMKVLDPACGEGALLAGVARAAEGELALYGVDVDADAIEVARTRLAAPGARVDLRVGESLALDWTRAFPEVLGAGGFDVVIGNPPYIRHERLGPLKAQLASGYESHQGAADLFVCFFELGLRLLRPGGRLAFVAPNKWLRVGYGAGLRGLLAREAVLERIVDFGHAPLFQGTDAFPCVVVLRREPPGPETMVAVSRIPREAKGSLHSQAEGHQHAVPQTRLGASPWRLEPRELDSLLEHIAQVGVPLKDVLGEPLRRGVLTGCNEAFVVEQATRDRLILEDPRSAELLHPVARGRDLGRWQVAEPVRFLIATRRGVDLERYPAIRAHLEGYRKRLTPRVPGASGPGRKPGRYAWYELQDTTAYWPIFEGPKILHTDISWRPGFSRSREPLVVLNSAYVWPTDDLYLLGVVNSPVMWAWMWRRATHGKDEALRLIRSFTETLPIPDAPADLQREVAEAVEALCAGPAPDRVAGLEARVTSLVIRAFGLDDDQVKLLYSTAPPRMPGGVGHR